MTRCNDNRRADPVEAHIGSKIREIRQGCGLTQRELGVAAGVSAQQIHRYEAAQSGIGAHTLFLIAQKLTVQVGAFFEGLSETPPTSLIFWEQFDPEIRKAAMEGGTERAQPHEPLHHGEARRMAS